MPYGGQAPDKGLPAPDIVLYLDISIADAEKRGGFGQERYEKRDLQMKVHSPTLQIVDILIRAGFCPRMNLQAALLCSIVAVAQQHLRSAFDAARESFSHGCTTVFKLHAYLCSHILHNAIWLLGGGSEFECAIVFR